MNIRTPAVAGQFYPAEPSVLKNELAKYIQPAAPQESAFGCVSPHAGYIYSGAVAGAVLSRVEDFETYVILGPNHTGLGSTFSILEGGIFRTPLGDVKIDEELSKAITKECSLVKPDERAHLYEHSIEVEVPFLQELKENFKIVPIVVSHADSKSYEKLGTAITDAIMKLKRKAFIIASSDMTHYEPHETAKEKDKKAIDCIIRLDVNGLLSVIAKEDISMCGYAPVSSMIYACKKLGARKGELIDYKTSGDTSGDYSSVVGYAGVLIK